MKNPQNKSLQILNVIQTVAIVGIIIFQIFIFLAFSEQNRIFVEDSAKIENRLRDEINQLKSKIEK